MSKKIWTYIISALAIIGGIFLIIKPEQSFANLIYYIGIVILVTGILKLLSSLINKSYLIPESSVLGGIVNIIFGIILMTNASLSVKIIPTFISIWLILGSIINLLLMFKFKKTYFSEKYLISNIFKLIIGIIVLTTPIISIIFTGTILGIILILIGLFTLFNTKKDTKIYKVKVK
jgi:Uncharacterized conserved protein